MSDFTFDGLKTTAKTRLGQTTDWASTLFYGTNERLLDAFCYTGEKLSVYGEYLLRESKWSKAQNRTSLLLQSPFIGYKPDRKRGATGYIEISTSSTYDVAYSGNSFTIPEWSSFTVDQKNVFLSENYIYNHLAQNITIPTVQGTPTELFFTCAGTMNEILTITNGNVDNTHIKVYNVINEVNKVYEEVLQTVSLFKITDPTILACEINNSLDYTQVQIKFGNNINGKATYTGQRIRIVYASTLGSKGNIYNLGHARPNFTLLDTLNNPIPLFAKINNYIDGGKDIETIDEIRQNAPDLFSTGYRAASKKDWEILLLNNTYINKIYVYGEYELRNDILAKKTLNQAISDGDLTASGRVPDIDNIAFITALDSAGNILTQVQKDSVVADYLHNDLDPKINVTTFVSWNDPQIISARLEVIATITKDKNATNMINLIKSTISNMYNVTAMNFYQNIYQSIIWKDISDITGIYKHTSNVYVRDLNSTPVVSNYTVNLPIIQPETFSIKVSRKINGSWTTSYLAGTDIPYPDYLTGIIKSRTHFLITNNSIDYLNGIINFSIRGNGLPRLLNGEFTDGMNNWNYDTNVEPKWILPSIINSSSLLESSTDPTLAYNKADNSYVMQILGNPLVTSPVKANNYVYQSISLEKKKRFLLNYLALSPQQNNEPNGNAVRITIGTSKDASDIADYIFDAHSVQYVLLNKTTAGIITALVGTDTTGLLANHTYYFNCQIDTNPEELVAVTTGGTSPTFSQLQTLIQNALNNMVSSTKADCNLILSQNAFQFKAQTLSNNYDPILANRKTGSVLITETNIATANKLFSNINNGSNITFDLILEPNIYKGENFWNEISVPFFTDNVHIAYFINMFMYSNTTNDKVYYDSIIIKDLTLNTSSSWGDINDVNNDGTGYLIEINYQMNKNGDILLQKRNQILDLESAQIDVTIEFE